MDDDVLDRALNTAVRRGASYADARLNVYREEVLAVKNGEVQGLTQTETQGLGVRVLADGAWGFAATHVLTKAAIDQTAALAVQIARAAARVSPRAAFTWGPPLAERGQYRTPVEIDPFDVPLESKLALLLEVDANMAREPGVRVHESSLMFSREDKHFASTEGARLRQTLYESGGGLIATAINDDDVQQRSYPNSAERHMGTAGYEFVLAMDLPGHAERTASEAVHLLSAPPCPALEATTVILGSAQMAVQIHESCGHPTELDRALGSEADYAGGSFLTPNLLGAFAYGSPHVTLEAEAVTPGGLGTFGWDDEGVPASRTLLVNAGRFVGYLMSRQTAARLGLPPNGCMRAAGWNRLPLVRMTNINLRPGSWSLADLIADTDDGLFMETNRSWSIDDQRYNFQFGTEVGYEIKGGRLGRLLKNCTYTGTTPEFWRSCDAVGNAEHWRMWGTPNCGKGQPVQIMHTGHRAAPARFRGVRVGVLM